MRVLYVVGSCLSKNTSANMSHNAYIQGLLENGCDVDIVMAEDSWGEEDQALPRWNQAHYYTFSSESFADRLRKGVRTRIAPATEETNGSNVQTVRASKPNVKQMVRSMAKKAFYFVFPSDPLYPLEHKWLKEAAKFKSKAEYDLVISNSSPAGSHKLVAELKKHHRIRYKRWIQIWEDPWYHDLYGNHPEIIEKEEHSLLREAEEVYYVSPLTMEYQKRYFPDCASKMKCIPLPFLKTQEETDYRENEISFGYFGDYYSQTRNLLPFYEALKKSGYRGYIYGDANLNLQPTKKIEVSGRVTLDRLNEIQNKTAVLVHLCNLCGGQIPGKIYHYSATHKPILFILDGTEAEKKIIRDFFEKFKRYYFCDNIAEEIEKTMHLIESELKKKTYCEIDAFSPQIVVSSIL